MAMIGFAFWCKSLKTFSATNGVCGVDWRNGSTGKKVHMPTFIFDQFCLFWVFVLLFLAVQGAGRLSLDHWLKIDKKPE